jgi:hypothetical protein
MKFKLKFPDAEPDSLHLGGQLLKTERIFDCRCGTRTGWRHVIDGLQMVCCSDECLIEQGGRSETVQGDLFQPTGEPT